MNWLLMSAVLAVAQELKQDEPPVVEPQKAKEVVVTATRTPRGTEDVPVPTYVITSDDLKRLTAQNAAEALRFVPGLSVQSQGGMPGARTEILSQGLPAKHFLVLVDGQRVRGTHAGAIDLSEIPIEQIDHMEVVQGPAASHFGSDAVAGVLNIITKRPPDKEADRTTSYGGASAIGGSERTFLERAHYALSRGDAGAVVTAGRQDTDGIERSFEYSGTSLFAKGRYDAGALGRISVQGGSYDERFPDSERAKRSAQLSWEVQLGSIADVRVAIREFWVDQESEEVISIPLAFESREREDEAEVQVDVFAIGSNVITAGGTWREETIDANTFPDGKNQSFRSAFAQDELSLFGGRLIVVAGFRVDDYSRAGTEFNPKGGFRLRITDTTIIRGSIGRGYKAPQLSDRFIAFDHGFAVLVGNPDLEPETSVGWQFGAEQRVGDWLVAGANFFRNDVEDMIAFNQFLGGSFIPGRGFVPTLGARNIARAWTQGVEVSASLRLSDAWAAGLAYTYLEGEDEDTNRDLELRPRHTAAGWLSYTHPIGFSATIEARFVDERLFMRRVGAATVSDHLGDYVVVNLKLRQRLWHGLHALGIVNNLLDREYEELPGVPMPGINFLAGLEYAF